MKSLMKGMISYAGSRWCRRRDGAVVDVRVDLDGASGGPERILLVRVRNPGSERPFSASITPSRLLRDYDRITEED